MKTHIKFVNMLIIFSLFLSVNVLAEKKSSKKEITKKEVKEEKIEFKPLEKVIRNSLPIKLRKILINKTTEAEILKNIGKPMKKDGNEWSYGFNSGKVDTALVFKKGVVVGFSYSYIKPSISVTELEATGVQGVDTGDPAFKSKNIKDIGKEREMHYAEENITIRYKKDSKRLLTNVVILGGNYK